MKKLLSVTILLILFFSFACGPVVKNPTPITNLGIQRTYPYIEQEYRVQVGDQLDVKFFYNPELNEQVTVRPILKPKPSQFRTQSSISASLTPLSLFEIGLDKGGNSYPLPTFFLFLGSKALAKLTKDSSTSIFVYFSDPNSCYDEVTQNACLGIHSW